MGNVVGPQNTWCNNWYCGGFCNHNSNAADNCEATMGDRQCCSEVFTNCAEVQLVGEFDPTASTTAAPVAPTTGAPTPTPAPIVSTPAPTTSGGGQGACVRNTDCGANPWCADTKYDSWCPSQSDCPSPQCTKASTLLHRQNQNQNQNPSLNQSHSTQLRLASLNQD